MLGFFCLLYGTNLVSRNFLFVPRARELLTLAQARLSPSSGFVQAGLCLLTLITIFGRLHHSMLNCFNYRIAKWAQNWTLFFLKSTFLTFLLHFRITHLSGETRTRMYQHFHYLPPRSAHCHNRASYSCLVSSPRSGGPSTNHYPNQGVSS